MVVLVVDVGLGIIGFDGFLVEVIFGYLVGIVIIEGGGIEEFVYYVFYEVWVRMCQGFLVLEDVLLVVFIVQYF